MPSFCTTCRISVVVFPWAPTPRTAALAALLLDTPRIIKTRNHRSAASVPGPAFSFVYMGVYCPSAALFVCHSAARGPRRAVFARWGGAQRRNLLFLRRHRFRQLIDSSDTSILSHLESISCKASKNLTAVLEDHRDFDRGRRGARKTHPAPHWSLDVLFSGVRNQS
jgi:hypothetical protein